CFPSPGAFLLPQVVKFSLCPDDRSDASQVISLGFGSIKCWIIGLHGRCGLSFLWFIEERWLAIPSFVCELRQVLDPILPAELIFLFLGGGSVWADVSKPLVPLSCACHGY